MKLEEAKQPEKLAESEEPGADEPKNKRQPLKPNDQTANKDGKEEDDKKADTGEIGLMELAALPASTLAGRSARDLLLRTRYGLNLLAVSRQGKRSLGRLRSMAIRSGDLLLIHDPHESSILSASVEEGVG